MRSSASRDLKYHPVLVLWPGNDDWPCGGEIVPERPEKEVRTSAGKRLAQLPLDGLRTRQDSNLRPEDQKAARSPAGACKPPAHAT
jgi:hypothetical protein